MLSIIACEKVMAPPSTPALGYALFFILLTSAIYPMATGCFESIISFGDSLADTGNLLRLAQSNVVKPRCSRLPYGETFFHRPTGRYSDGRLVVDFLAGQPSVGGENSNLSGQSFEKGVNFAVAGATALDHEYLEARGIYNPLTNVSLGVQMDWFKRFLGTRQGCINWLNEFSRYHNGLLEKELNRIRELHPRISIIYADYYNGALLFFISPNEFGFGKGSVLSACCGGGGLYNYNVSVVCSFPPATCCEDPSLYVSWDGVHLTEAAYRFLAQGLLEGNYTVPHLSSICSPSFRIPAFYEY